MAKDARHGNIARAPWWAKVEIEFVVLHISVASDIMLQNLESGSYADEENDIQCWLVHHSGVGPRIWQ